MSGQFPGRRILWLMFTDNLCSLRSLLIHSNDARSLHETSPTWLPTEFLQIAKKKLHDAEF